MTDTIETHNEEGQTVPRPQKPLPRWLRMMLLGFVLLAAAFLSAITTMRLAIRGHEVEVPRVIRMKAGDAQALLLERKLGLKIADREYSEFAADHVVRQSPPPGTQVKTGQRVHVVLSLGPQKVIIPELEGQSVRAARIQLLRSGLQVGEISQAHLPGWEPDVVVQQHPPPRATDVGSPRVALLVSLGPQEEAYVMPDLVGLSLAEAQRRAVTGGLRVAKIAFAPSAELPRGTVVAHTPRRGERVLAGTTVELQVADGSAALTIK